MSEIVAWLESREGDSWRRASFEPVGFVVAQIWPGTAFSTTWSQTFGPGPVRPEHDPCGRPPIRA